MIRFAGLIGRIDVDDDERQIIQMMKELVPDLGCNRMRLCNRQFGVDSKCSTPHVGGARAIARELR